MDRARRFCSSRLDYADRRDLAGVKAWQMADRGKAESCRRKNKPQGGEGDLAFHSVGLQSVLITLVFPPQLPNEAYIETMMLHCNIAHAAKTEACCRMPLSALVSLDYKTFSLLP